jgi:hypothetical protein
MHTYTISEIIQQISSNTYDKLIECDTIKATFYTNEEVNEKYLKSFFDNKKCVLGFISEKEKIAWKNADQDDFHVLEIDNDEDAAVFKICQNFIFGELKKDNNGEFLIFLIDSHNEQES